MARKQQLLVTLPTTAAAPPTMTAGTVLADWKAQGATLYETQKTFPSKATAVRRLGSIEILLRKDKALFLRRGTTQAQLDALSLLRAEGLALQPMQRQEKKEVKQLPQPSAGLIDRAVQRVTASASVAAGRLGPASLLTTALGFNDVIVRTAPKLTEALTSQRLVILQQDAQGHDLPDAVANRALLTAAGLDGPYVDDMIAPLLIELAPFAGVVPDPALHSVMEWECSAMVAAKYFGEQAALSLQSPRRIGKYQAAQPLSQIGRFARLRRKKKRQQLAGLPPGTTKAAPKQGKKGKKGKKKSPPSTPPGSGSTPPGKKTP